jgi:hypothetical protein
VPAKGSASAVDPAVDRTSATEIGQIVVHEINACMFRKPLKSSAPDADLAGRHSAIPILRRRPKDPL